MYDFNFPAFLGNDIIINEVLILFSFWFIKFSNIWPGCYKLYKRTSHGILFLALLISNS